jgi:hypothetical protein
MTSYTSFHKNYIFRLAFIGIINKIGSLMNVLELIMYDVEELMILKSNLWYNNSYFFTKYKESSARSYTKICRLVIRE